MIKFCKYCGKEFESAKKFQSYCCDRHRLNQSMIRRYSKKKNLKYNIPIERCVACGYDFMPILEVHHIDRDKTNNNPANLEVLCPNCHRKKHLAYQTTLDSDFVASLVKEKEELMKSNGRDLNAVNSD